MSVVKHYVSITAVDTRVKYRVPVSAAVAAALAAATIVYTAATNTLVAKVVSGKRIAAIPCEMTGVTISEALNELALWT